MTEIEMIENIEKCFSNSLLIETYKNYNRVWEQKPQFPYFNYLGINFDAKGVVSVKFYFHVFRKITQQEVELFLPTTEDFNKYYFLYQESLVQNIEHSGCAFEVKFFPDKETPIQGFHFRVKSSAEAYKLIGLPQRLPFILDENYLPTGINYEYRLDNVLRKTYYYLSNEEHKKYFAQRFHLPFLETASLIEYSESDVFSKINTWYGNDPAIYSNANILPQPQREVTAYLCEKYKLSAKAYGFYENSDVKAVYLFDAAPKTSLRNNTYTDTMKNLRCND